MADVIITLTIPDANVATVKAAIEYFAQQRGILENGQTFTANQAIAAIKILCSERIKEIVRVYHYFINEQIAQTNTNTETNSVNIS